MEKSLLHLDNFIAISLSEMKGIKLMNRIDTKYLTNIDFLPDLLEMAKPNYRIQVVDGNPVGMYQTLYYDTPDADMYTLHHNQKLQRQKVRTRTYIDSNLSFLEIKHKTNTGRTKKKRIEIDTECFSDFRKNEKAVAFFNQESSYAVEELMPQVVNSFDRITLVNNEKTERLTIDFNVTFKNCNTGQVADVPNMMIIELKQDGLCHSLFKDYLLDMRIKPVSISKYCLGTILTNEHAKLNRFKKKIMYINKVCNLQIAIN